MKSHRPRPRVGIDLAGAEAGATAPGTARLVTEQSRALFALDVDWDWAPVVASRENPLWELAAPHAPSVVPGNRVSLRALLRLGPAWRRAGCSAGFTPSGLVPLSGPPLIANFFDASIYEHGQTWIDSGRRRSYYIIRLLGSVAMRRARKLLILSEYGKQRMIEYFPATAQKWVVNPGGLSELPAPPAERPGWAAGLHGAFFVSVGAFSENKNQRRLIQAWGRLQAKFPDFPALVLIGPADDSFLQTVIVPARQACPRPGGILLAGRVPDPELSWAYANASACIQPSIAEGFNLCILEAMKFRLPVACSDTTTTPETAGGAALLFSPFEPADIANAAERIWRDEALSEDLIGRGSIRHQLYTWRASAEGVARQIESLLRQIKPGGAPSGGSNE